MYSLMVSRSPQKSACLPYPGPPPDTWRLGEDILADSNRGRIHGFNFAVGGRPEEPSTTRLGLGFLKGLEQVQ